MTEENKMPGMPGMPGMNTEVKTEENVQAEPTLNVPSQETEDAPEETETEIGKPLMKGDENTISNAKEVIIPKGGIEVVALRKGFYNNNRIIPGQRFRVSAMDKLGLWMECVDPTLEKERKKMLAGKKEARRKFLMKQG